MMVGATGPGKPDLYLLLWTCLLAAEQTSGPKMGWTLARRDPALGRRSGPSEEAALQQPGDAPAIS